MFAYRVSALCAIASNPFIVIIGNEKSKESNTRLEKEIANAGVPPRDDLVLPFEEDMNDDQAPINPPPITVEDIRADLFQMAQDIITQAQDSTTQSQAITVQDNREVVPRAHQ